MSVIVVDELAGTVYPPRTDPDVLTEDARTIALRGLATYLMSIRFKRKGAAQPYQIPAECIFIEQPDNEVELRFPSLAVLPGVGDFESYSLGGPEVDESTWHVFGEGTALVFEGMHVETITLEVWAASKPERRGLMLGIQRALRPSLDVKALRLQLPEYFFKVCTFDLQEVRYIDDPDVVRGRHRGHVVIDMRVPVVKLINVSEMIPLMTVEATEEDLT